MLLLNDIWIYGINNENLTNDNFCFCFFIVDITMSERNEDLKSTLFIERCAEWKKKRLNTDLFVEWCSINNAFDGYFIDTKMTKSSERVESIRFLWCTKVCTWKKKKMKWFVIFEYSKSNKNEWKDVQERSERNWVAKMK